MAESSGTNSSARFPRDARPAWLNDPLIVQVRDLYTRKGLSTRTIADALGLSRWRVDRVLRAAGVSVAPRGAGRARPRRPAEDLDRFGDEARALYEREGLSTRKIAETLRLSRPQVDRVLRAAGATVAPRGAGRARPSRRYQDPHEFGDTLRKLYSGERLSRRQVSERLSLSEGLVRERLAEYGIESRTRGRCNREDRHCLREDQYRQADRADLHFVQVGRQRRDRPAEADADPHRDDDPHRQESVERGQPCQDRRLGGGGWSLGDIVAHVRARGVQAAGLVARTIAPCIPGAASW